MKGELQLAERQLVEQILLVWLQLAEHQLMEQILLVWLQLAERQLMEQILLVFHPPLPVLLRLELPQPAFRLQLLEYLQRASHRLLIQHFIWNLCNTDFRSLNHSTVTVGTILKSDSYLFDPHELQIWESMFLWKPFNESAKSVWRIPWIVLLDS